MLLDTPSTTPTSVSAPHNNMCGVVEVETAEGSREAAIFDHEPAISVQDVFSRPLGVRFGLEFFKKLNQQFSPTADCEA